MLKLAAATLLALCVAALGGESPRRELVPAGGRPALRIVLLGTGNPRPSPERSGPATLIEASASVSESPVRLLVDAGRGTAERLFALGGRDLLSGIDLVLLTHLHSDHVVGLPDVWLTGWLFGRARALSLKGPEGTAALASHLARAYEFDVKTRRDLEARVSLMAKDATRRVIEHHTTPEEAGRVFAAVKPRLAVYSHIVPSPARAEDLEGPTRKTYTGPLVVGEDGTVIEVGETVEVRRAALR